MKTLYTFTAIILAIPLLAQWTPQNSQTTNNLNALHFMDDHHAYVVGDSGTVKFTADAGLNWNDRSLPSKGNISSVYFTVVPMGWITADDGLWRTIDAGQTWTLVTDTIWPTEVKFTTSLAGYVGTSDGKILTSFDGGLNWTTKESGLQGEIRCIQFPTHQVGFAIGGYAWEYAKTTDGGQTWTTHTIAPILNQSILEAVFFTSPQNGFIGGWYNPSLVKTTDWNQSWGNSDTSGIQVFDLYFPSTFVGYAATPYGEIYVTGDAGGSWTKQQATASNIALNAVQFHNDGLGIAVGSNGTIITTDNGGGALSITENNTSTLNIYPIPASDVLHVEFKGDLNNSEWQIVHMNGRSTPPHFISQEDGSLTISVAKLPAGEYLLMDANNPENRSTFIIN